MAEFFHTGLEKMGLKLFVEEKVMHTVYTVYIKQSFINKYYIYSSKKKYANLLKFQNCLYIT